MTGKGIRARRNRLRLLIVLGVVLVLSLLAAGEERFPRPDFENPYQYPAQQQPQARSLLLEYLDVLLLVGALVLATWLSLKRRSRRGLFLLMVGSLIYFGFLRRGCVCAVGSFQNLSLALFGSGYVIPLTVLAFFLLPLAFALYGGRSFCASVCPLGAVQDVVHYRPLRLPSWLNRVLGIIPFVYLGLAVLLAATGAAFVVCRFDPFIALFRMGGSTFSIVLGVGFLLLGLVVARPYCRFLCPYGALLNLFSRVSRYRVSITPDECIECRLCEDACPFQAIEAPQPPVGEAGLETGRRRLRRQLLLLPLFVLLGLWLGQTLSPLLAGIHPRVQLASRIHGEEQGRYRDQSEESKAFRASGTSLATLYQEATAAEAGIHQGALIFGAYLGLVLFFALVGSGLRPPRSDYRPHPGNCLSCGRCFSYCPVGTERESQVKTELETTEKSEETQHG